MTSDTSENENAYGLSRKLLYFMTPDTQNFMSCAESLLSSTEADRLIKSTAIIVGVMM